MGRPPSTNALRTVRRLCGANRRQAALALRVVKVLVLMLAVQMSGVAHHIADLVFHDDRDAHCGHERSGGTDDDSECPPGCPTCHACAHAQVPYVPGTPSLTVSPLARVIDRPRPEPFGLPRGEVPFVYRPPRASRVAIM